MGEVLVRRLGLVGFGSVGRAFARLLMQEGPRLRTEQGVDLLVTGLTTARSGSVVDPAGIDLSGAVARAQRGERHGSPRDAMDFAASCPADVIVETLPLEPFTGAFAAAVIRQALSRGCSVVSANKGPVAHQLHALAGVAAAHGATYRYEAAVADGLPVFNLIAAGLPGAEITGFSGLVNSTSNVVLDAMARGGGLDDGLAIARSLGIAEADPSSDLSGLDAAVKLAALSASVWGKQLPLAEVRRDSVDAAAAGPAADAADRGERLVSLAELTLTERGPTASVQLVAVGVDHPFAALTGTSLGLRITSRLLCPITVSSCEPGVADTAYGLLADLLTLPRPPSRQPAYVVSCVTPPSTT